MDPLPIRSRPLGGPFPNHANSHTIRPSGRGTSPERASITIMGGRLQGAPCMPTRLLTTDSGVSGIANGDIMERLTLGQWSSEDVVRVSSARLDDRLRLP